MVGWVVESRHGRARASRGSSSKQESWRARSRPDLSLEGAVITRCEDSVSSKCPSGALLLQLHSASLSHAAHSRTSGSARSNGASVDPPRRAYTWSP